MFFCAGAHLCFLWDISYLSPAPQQQQTSHWKRELSIWQALSYQGGDLLAEKSLGLLS